MKIDITHVAKLANLKIAKEDETKFHNQLSSILDYIARLNEVDTKDVEETSQVTGLENILREDNALPSLPQKEAVSQAKHNYKGFFAVKGVFENE